MCLPVSISLFESNQNGHNSANFEAMTARFCMVVDLEDEDDNNKDDKGVSALGLYRDLGFFAERNKANPCGAASFAKPR